MKETFTVSVVNTKTQGRNNIESNAETLGQLKEELRAAGISFDGMTFMEGSTKTELKDDSSILPTNVPVKRGGVATGETTNNLVFFLTAPEKHISSGAVTDRKEAYAYMKAHPEVAKAFTAKFGKNYTNGSTADLIAFCNAGASKPASTKTVVKTVTKKTVVKEENAAPAAPASECGYCDVLENTKKFVENLHNAGILSDENYNGFQSIFEGGDVPSVATGYSNSDIDEMYGDWMKK